MKSNFWLDLQDAYKSIREALSQAGTYNDRKVEVHFVTPNPVGVSSS